MVYQVRPATEEDYPVICSFTNNEQEQFYFSPSSRFPLTVGHIKEKMQHRLSPTVVLDDNHIVGFGNFYDHELGQRAFIGNVVVRKQNRRQGVATYLINKMLHMGFQQHDFREVHISCFTENTAGIILYHKLGFEPYAIEPRRTRSGKTVVLIHLKLLRDNYALSF